MACVINVDLSPQIKPFMLLLEKLHWKNERFYIDIFA
jgi:hypothetical protein